MALIQAIPAAAAAPERKDVGIDQKATTQHRAPLVTIVSAASCRTGEPSITASMVMPTTHMAKPPAVCQRRSPVRSEFQAHSTCTMAVTPHGIMLSRPICRKLDEGMPNSEISVGIQKLVV